MTCSASSPPRGRSPERPTDITAGRLAPRPCRGASRLCSPRALQLEPSLRRSPARVPHALLRGSARSRACARCWPTCGRTPRPWPSSPASSATRRRSRPARSRRHGGSATRSPPRPSLSSSGALVDLDDIPSRERLARQHARLLAAHGMQHLDISEVRSRSRPVTQAISRSLYDEGAAGVRFRSNLDDQPCTALFEGRGPTTPVAHPPRCFAARPASVDDSPPVGARAGRLRGRRCRAIPATGGH